MLHSQLVRRFLDPFLKESCHASIVVTSCTFYHPDPDSGSQSPIRRALFQCGGGPKAWRRRTNCQYGSSPQNTRKRLLWRRLWEPGAELLAASLVVLVELPLSTFLAQSF